MPYAELEKLNMVTNPEKKSKEYLAAEDNRSKELSAVLKIESANLRRWGRVNYIASHTVGWLIIVSSVVAGAGGFSGLLPPEFAQVIALFPAALVLISQRQK